MFLLKCELFLRCYCYDGTVRVVQRCGMLHMFQRGLLSALCLFGSSVCVCAEVHSIATKDSATHTFNVCLRSRSFLIGEKVKRTLCMKQLSHFKPGLTNAKMANGLKPENIFSGNSLSHVRGYKSWLVNGSGNTFSIDSFSRWWLHTGYRRTCPRWLRQKQESGGASTGKQKTAPTCSLA